MNLILFHVLEYLNLLDLEKVFTFLSENEKSNYLKNAKFIISSPHQLNLFRNMVNNNRLNHLEVIYTLSHHDMNVLKTLKGKYIKLHCTKASGSLLDINDVLQNFVKKDVYFYSPFMNLSVTFNLLMANSNNITIIFHCDWLFIDENTIIEKLYIPDSYYHHYNLDGNITYLTKEDVSSFFDKHPFLNVLVNRFEITPYYFKCFN
jgi:hypothetical protein